MASLADAEEALRPTLQKSNFQRLTRLLMCGGAVLLRETFDSIHSPANLPTTLSNPSVERQLRGARLTIPEKNCLFPSPGVYGKSSDFDISLIFKLLRTICNLTPPPTGCDILPNNSDQSLEADLIRIKYYRNDVYGHGKTQEMPDDQFVDLWRKISGALLRIAANLSPENRDNWKDAIKKLLHDPLTSEEERYAEELALWYEEDLEVKKTLQVVREEFTRLKQEFFQEIREMRGDVKGLTQQVAAKLRLENTIERITQSVPGEIQSNQRELPAEMDIWNVIMAFRHPFRQLLEYLGNKLNALVEDIELGSLSITVKCGSLQSLEALWEDYISGYLNQVVQETLVTQEVLQHLGLDEVKLKVFISKDEYENGKQIFTENAVPSNPSCALKNGSANGNRGNQVGSKEADLPTTFQRKKHGDMETPELDTASHEPSEKSTALEEQKAQVSQDHPGLGSLSQNKPTTAKQEKQWKTERCATNISPQVILISGKEITRGRVYFDPDLGKLVCSKILKEISDRAVVIDMNKAGIGGFFCLFL